MSFQDLKQSKDWFRDYKKSDAGDKKHTIFAILGLFVFAGVAFTIGNVDLGIDANPDTKDEIGKITRIGDTELHVVNPIPQ